MRKILIYLTTLSRRNSALRVFLGVRSVGIGEQNRKKGWFSYCQYLTKHSLCLFPVISEQMCVIALNNIWSNILIAED